MLDIARCALSGIGRRKLFIFGSRSLMLTQSRKVVRDAFKPLLFDYAQAKRSLPRLWNLAAVPSSHSDTALSLLKKRPVDVIFKQEPESTSSCINIDVCDKINSSQHRLTLPYEKNQELAASRKFNDTLMFLLRNCTVNELLLDFASMDKHFRKRIKFSDNLCRLPANQLFAVNNLVSRDPKGEFLYIFDRVLPKNLVVWTFPWTIMTDAAYDRVFSKDPRLPPPGALLFASFLPEDLIDKLMLSIRTERIIFIEPLAWSLNGLKLFIEQWKSGERKIEKIVGHIRNPDGITPAEFVRRLRYSLSSEENRMKMKIGQTVEGYTVNNDMLIHDPNTTHPQDIPFVQDTLIREFPHVDDVMECFGCIRFYRNDKDLDDLMTLSVKSTEGEAVSHKMEIRIVNVL